VNVLWLSRRLVLPALGSVLFLAVLAIFESATQGTFAEVASKRMAGTGRLNADPSADQLPAGFKVERYLRLWERNPFTLSQAVPETPPSALENLYLIGWLNDGAKELIYVQNWQTNEVQRITPRANANNLRLIEIHLSSDLRLVNAVIAAGQERATVKFHFDSRVAPGITSSTLAKNETNTSSGQVPIPSNTTSRYYPGVPRVRTEGDNPSLNKRSKFAPKAKAPLPGQS
jgi:hypothetical protein